MATIAARPAIIGKIIETSSSTFSMDGIGETNLGACAGRVIAGFAVAAAAGGRSEPLAVENGATLETASASGAATEELGVTKAG